MVIGEGKNSSIEHLLKLAALADLPEQEANEIIEQVRNALNQWHTLAKQAGVTTQMQESIAEKIT